MTEETKKEHRGCWVGVPEIFELAIVCDTISRAFGGDTCYLVGSATERRDFRDVDVRLIMGDKKWRTLFGDERLAGEMKLFWSLMCIAIGEYMARRTGLRIDFQIQSMSQANGPQHGEKSRHPLGLFPINIGPERAEIDLLAK